MNLKLFVWENVLPDYSGSAIFALAADVEAARLLVLKDKKDWQQKSLSLAMAGEPKAFVEPVGFIIGSIE